MSMRQRPPRLAHPGKRLAGTWPLPAMALLLIALMGTMASAPASATPARHTPSPAHSSAVQARPASRLAPRAVLPATTCSLSGSTRACDLYAMTGTLPLPSGATATSVPIWGYATSAAGPATLPGPVLIANQGETLVINLHNVNVPTATALTLSQTPAIPDTTGVTAGNSKTYTFSSLQPGTYLYEAGLTPNGPRAVAMGLNGALVVRPTACGAANGCAYDANSAYEDEAALVLSEVDPAFNANPLGFNMPDYAPKYWLINGKAYPQTDPIPAVAGDRVLLRYVNAGLKHHSMSLLGLHETLVGIDAKPLTNPSTVTAQTIPAGTSLDAIATVPASAPAGTRYALLDAAMHLDNNGVLTTPGQAASTIAYGGMLTFLKVAGTPVPSTAPITSNVALVPNPTNGSVSVTLSANAQATAPNTITAMEYFIDTLPAPSAYGTGGAMTITASGPSVTASHTFAPTDPNFANLSSGNHTFYVHAQDNTGQWGPAASATLNLDKTGPSISNMSLTPAFTNGTVDVQIQATASDALTGNQNVVRAEYFIDPVGTPAPGSTGSTAFSVATPAPDVSLSATILAARVNALPEGAHTIAIRAEDALNNWGAFGTITLTVDKTGPQTSSVAIYPTPTNGLWGSAVVGSDAFYEVVTAHLQDLVSNGVNSNIVGGEYFIDSYPTDPSQYGTGGAQALQPTTGSFNSPSADGQAWIYIYQIRALTEGTHTVYVHAKDAAGNWGPFMSTTFVVDKTGPNITNAAATPINSTSFTLTATATDPANPNGTPAPAPASNVIAAEWFIGTDPGAGNGTPIPVTAPAPSVNLSATINYTGARPIIFVRAEDAAHNWGPAVQASWP